MADELLPYYEKELAFIRQLGNEFARKTPKLLADWASITKPLKTPRLAFN